MGISTRQYQDIMNEYDAVRRRNYMAEQERKERIYALIPEIRRIDEEIAHVSVAKAKEMLLKKISNADAKKSLQSTIYDLSMEKVNLLAIHDYPAEEAEAGEAAFEERCLSSRCLISEVLLTPRRFQSSKILFAYGKLAWCVASRVRLQASIIISVPRPREFHFFM